MDFLSNEDVRANDNIRMEPQEYIQSQYSASPAICQILGDFRDKIKTDIDLTIVLKKLVDIDTASGVALDNLGKIVNIGRTLPLDDGSSVLLDDEYYRRLLKYKMMTNITEADADTINSLMAILYEGSDTVLMIFTKVEEAKDGDRYYNAKPMHVRGIIDGDLSDLDLALFKYAGILCIGAGVGWEPIVIDSPNTFGFLGQELQPFNQGVFWNGTKISSD